VGVNVLSRRKVARIADAAGQPVVWAWVLSHVESGRWAECTTADHRHGRFDRVTGQWSDDDGPCRRTSCRSLFDGEPDEAEVRARVEAMRAGCVDDPNMDMPCVVDGCNATGRGTAGGGGEMLCRGYGALDARCRADWMSADPEDWGLYADWVREHSHDRTDA
jgi:hypothetical protein